MKRISEKEYNQDFGIDKASPNAEKCGAALKNAIDTRQFEIELYWERAKYFWTFIGAAFASFGVIQKISEGPEETFLSILVSCLGLLFSFAWYCVNRGSKQWQENWENHVSLLEDQTIGPLFKTVLSRDDSRKDRIRDLFFGPAPFSVSKINQMVSLYVTLFWLFLLGYSTPIDFEASIKPSYCIPIILTFLSCFCIFRFARSDFNDETVKIDHWHIAKRFTSKIMDKNGSEETDKG